MLRVRLSSTTLFVFSLLLAFTILPVPTFAQTTDDVPVYKTVVEHFRRDGAFIPLRTNNKIGIAASCDTSVLKAIEEDVADGIPVRGILWAAPLLTVDVVRDLREQADLGGVSRDWLERSGVFLGTEVMEASRLQQNAGNDGDANELLDACRWFFSPVVYRGDLAYVLTDVWCGPKSAFQSVIIIRRGAQGWHVIDVAALGMS